MITKEDISRIDWEAVKHTDKDFVASSAFVEMTQIAYEILKERDEALRRGDAYREVAIENHGSNHMGLQCLWGARQDQCVDYDLNKILEQEAKSKEGKI